MIIFVCIYHSKKLKGLGVWLKWYHVCLAPSSNPSTAQKNIYLYISIYLSIYVMSALTPSSAFTAAFGFILLDRRWWKWAICRS
jgi:hypothetical protein